MGVGVAVLAALPFLVFTTVVIAEVYRLLVVRFDSLGGGSGKSLTGMSGIGAVVFFALRQTLADYGVWYLVRLGVIGMVVAIWLPRGLWGFVSDRTGASLFPVGYFVKIERTGEAAGRETGAGRSGN